MAQEKSRSQGTQEHRLRDIHRRALDPIDRQHGAGAPVQGRVHADGRGSYERGLHAHLSHRLLVSLLYCRVQVRLFLPQVRLGRSALQPPLPEHENPARVPALARDTIDAELRAAQPGARTRRRSRRERLVYGCLSRLLRVGVRRAWRAEGRELFPEREYHKRKRRAVVGLRHDHHRRLRRPLSDDQCWPHRRHLRDDRRRGLVRHPQRFPGQHVPLAAQEERGASRDASQGRRPQSQARRAQADD